jgi:hypothetical protein
LKRLAENKHSGQKVYNTGIWQKKHAIFAKHIDMELKNNTVFFNFFQISNPRQSCEGKTETRRRRKKSF